MSDEVRDISIQVRATEAIRDLNKLAAANDKVAASVEVTDSATGKMVRQLLRASDVSTNVARSISKIKDGVAASDQEVRRFTKDTNDAASGLMRFGTAGSKALGHLKDLESQVNRMTGQQLKQLEDQLPKALGDIFRDSASGRFSSMDASRLLSSTPTKELEAITQAYQLQRQTLEDLVAEELRRRSATAETAKETSKVASDLSELKDTANINALRYAMYDVSNTFARARDMVYGMGEAIFTTGIEFEKNFAHVERTSELTGTALANLRQAFVDLQTSIPVSSEELARIGTLAAQMGIEASNIANFTEVTAKFSATSGVGIEESATALARVGMLLRGDVQDNYERLASSILETGINAIATEQQIVRGTTQIAAMGRTAGLSAVDVVALSSAMSSLGMSPELQRSVITSSFTRILAAVRGTTQQAEKFGEVLGMTGRQFQEAWNNDAYNTYNRFLRAVASSPNAVTTLQDLRLASQRLTPNLLRMGQSFELLEKTHQDASRGWVEQATLQKQYNVIAEQTAAAIQVLEQAWEAFLVVVGKDAVAALGDVSRTLTEVIKWLTEFASHPIGGRISNMVILFGALAAVGLSLITMFTLLAGGALGFAFVMSQLSGQMGGPMGLVNLMARMVFGTKAWATSNNTAALSLALLTRAAKLLGVAVLGITLAPLVGEAIPGISRWADEQVNGLDSLEKKISQAIGSRIPSTIRRLQMQMPRIGADVFIDAAGIDAAFRSLDEDLARIALTNPERAASTYLKLQRVWKDSGGVARDFEYAMRDTREALNEGAEAAGISSGSVKDYADSLGVAADETEALAMAEAELATRHAMIADALGILEEHGYAAADAVAALANAFKSGTESFFDFEDMLGRAYSTDPKNLGKGLGQFSKELATNLKEFGEWEWEVQQLVARGASHLAMAFIEKGPETRKAVQDALKLKDSDLGALEDNMRLAAFLSSQAYADTFAAQNAILAEVYKQTGDLSIVKQVIAAYRSDRGLSAAERLELEQKYKIQIPVELDPENFLGDIDLFKTIKENAEAKLTENPILLQVNPRLDTVDFDNDLKAWLVTDQEGRTLVLGVSPDTDEGARQIEAWRNNEKKKALEIGVAINEAQLTSVRTRLRQLGLTFNVGAGGAGLRTAFREGGLFSNGRAYRDNYPGYANGTIVRGPGTGTSDSILARISNGEAITRARAVRYYGSKMMEDINNMRFPRYATGFTPAGYAGQRETSSSVNVNVIQNNPVTRDPLRQLREDSELVVAGVWG